MDALEIREVFQVLLGDALLLQEAFKDLVALLLALYDYVLMKSKKQSENQCVIVAH